MVSPSDSSDSGTDEEEKRYSRRDVVKIGVFTAGGVAVGSALGFLGGSGSRQQEVDSLNARLAAITKIYNLPPLSSSISMLNWSQYTNYALLDGFVEKIKVQMDYSEAAQTEDDFRLQLKQDNPNRYDIMVVTDYAVQEAIQAGKLVKLKKEYIPNLDYLDPSFNHSWDPTNDYSLPYLWGTTGIGWNQTLVKFPAGQTTLNSWAQFFDTSANGFLAQNTGKVTVIADRDEALAAAAIHLGKDVNDLSPGTLDQIKTLLLSVKPFLATFADADAYYTGLGSGSFFASHAWSGDVLFIREGPPRMPEIMYTIPNEGVHIWTDNYVIPINAPNPDTASVFINYMWEASNAAILAMFRNYMIANRLSLKGGALDTSTGGNAGMIIPYTLSQPDINPYLTRPDLAGKLYSLRARTETENTALNTLWNQILA